MAATHQSSRRDVRQEVTDRIIEALDEGHAPWMKPWDEAQGAFHAHNPVSGTHYHGVNQLLLSADERNDTDPRWCTYKQAQQQGWQVRRGEHGTRIVRVVAVEREREVVNQQSGERETEVEQRPVLKVFTVFHASQIEGIPELETTRDRPTPARLDRAEAMLEATGIAIRHDGGNRAFYAPQSDTIHLPPIEAFHSTEGYYATALHETGHATGHPDRLDRETLREGVQAGFGSAQYAREELRAELASAMLGAELGLRQDQSHIDQHAAYIDSWRNVLANDKREIFRAAHDAERAADWVLEREREYSQDQTIAEQTARQEPDYEHSL